MGKTSTRPLTDEEWAKWLASTKKGTLAACILTVPICCSRLMLWRPMRPVLVDHLTVCVHR